jgi:hypothetical protein
MSPLHQGHVKFYLINWSENTSEGYSYFCSKNMSEKIKSPNLNSSAIIRVFNFNTKGLNCEHHLLKSDTAQLA